MACWFLFSCFHKNLISEGKLALCLQDFFGDPVKSILKSYRMSETLDTELPRLDVSISFVPDVLDDVSDISDGDIPDVPDKDVDEDFEPADLKQGAFKKHLLEGCRW